MQHCQLPKIRNVLDHLPGRCQADRPRRLRAAYAMGSYADAKTALQKFWPQLRESNPSAGRRLEEGLEGTVTLPWPSVGALLRRSFLNTNIIESCLSTVRQVGRNVKRSYGDHVARRPATGLPEARKKFRTVKGDQNLKELTRKINSVLHLQARVAQNAF